MGAASRGEQGHPGGVQAEALAVLGTRGGGQAGGFTLLPTLKRLALPPQPPYQQRCHELCPTGGATSQRSGCRRCRVRVQGAGSGGVLGVEIRATST